MKIDARRMTHQDKPTLTVLFFVQGFLMIDGHQYSFTNDEDKATTFSDRYEAIVAVVRLGVPGNYTITDVWK